MNFRSIPLKGEGARAGGFYGAGMRNTGNTKTKRGSGRVWALPILPFAVFVALLLPVGAGAGVKQEAADPAVMLPSSIFGLGTAMTSSARSQADFDERHCDKDNGHDKKCDELPNDEVKPGTDDDPNASWAGLPTLPPLLP